MKKPPFNRYGVVFALSLLVTGTAWAQGVRLVQDINPGIGDAFDYGTGFLLVNGIL